MVAGQTVLLYRETLGPTKTFDGICLYLPERLEKDVWTLDCVHPQVRDVLATDFW